MTIPAGPGQLAGRPASQPASLPATHCSQPSLLCKTTGHTCAAFRAPFQTAWHAAVPWHAHGCALASVPPVRRSSREAKSEVNAEGPSEPALLRPARCPLDRIHVHSGHGSCSPPAGPITNLAENSDAGGLVEEVHCCLHLVHILATCPAGPCCAQLNVLQAQPDAISTASASAAVMHDALMQCGSPGRQEIKGLQQ